MAGRIGRGASCEVYRAFEKRKNLRQVRECGLCLSWKSYCGTEQAIFCHTDLLGSHI